MYFYITERIENLDLLAIEDPFPKWLGEDKIAIGYVEGHPLDGGETTYYMNL